MNDDGHYEVTEDERDSLFGEQVMALDSSAKAFDNGSKWEAKRLAAATYILCHDAPFKKSKIKSLLGQMGLKDKLSFLSSRNERPSPYSLTPLITLSLSEHEPAFFQPNLESHSDSWKWMSFNKWWNEAVYEAWNGRTLSRKNLVFALRSQDGGAHADEFIRDEDYQQFKTLMDPRLQRNKLRAGERTGFRFVDAGGVKVRGPFLGAISGSPTDARRPDENSDWEPIPGAHLASMRQIAFELLRSIGTLIGQTEK